MIFYHGRHYYCRLKPLRGLSRQACGLKALFFEKEAFPRHKPCRGAVSEQALSYLDFSIPNEISEEEIYGVKVFYKGRSVVGRKSYRLAITVTRSRFDHFQLKKAEEAGAEVRDLTAVTDYREDSRGVIVSAGGREYPTHYFITAEGSNGSLNRRVRRADTEKEYAIAVECGVKVGPGRIQNGLDSFIEIDFSAVFLLFSKDKRVLISSSPYSILHVSVYTDIF